MKTPPNNDAGAGRSAMTCSDEIPLFSLVRYNSRRAARGAEAAEVEATWPDGETETLWMSEDDINENAKIYGWQEGLRLALTAYRQNAESAASGKTPQ